LNTITGTVSSMIFRSNHTPCWPMYSRSYRHLRPHVLDARVVAVVDLRPAGDARLDPVPERVLADVLAEAHHDARALGARPDDVHLAAQHVDQLRHLVEARLPEHPADRA
jgi:hypothetical protein